MAVMTKVLAIMEKLAIPHTRLPSVFMKKVGGVDSDPTEFVGDAHRVPGAEGFIDDRIRNEEDYVNYAPRKVRPDLLGGGILVSEDYPQLFLIPVLGNPH